jgi:hypothetical protein
VRSRIMPVMGSFLAARRGRYLFTIAAPPIGSTFDRRRISL